MKTLYLIRHAKSSWKDFTLSDIDRPLNNRGKRDAPEMGRRLKEKNILPSLIISSPALRAFTTAKIIANQIGYSEESIITEKDLYECNSSGIIELIKKTENAKDPIYIFGHNPEFTDLANYFTKKNISNIPTCGIFCVNFDVTDWTEISPRNAGLVFFDFPRNNK
jgi:phosphohistidine phosphatase